MKKIISLFIVIAMLFSVLTPCVFSEETVSEQKENLENALFFTCTYDAEKKQVIIDGTVNHDIMVSHEDYTIKIYSILP